MVYSYLKPNALYINLKFNLKPRANRHNVVGPQLLTLLVVTFCLLLHALLHIVACYPSVSQQCWIRLLCSSNIFRATQEHYTWSPTSYGLFLPTIHWKSQHSSLRFHYKNRCRISESLNLVSLYLRKIFSLACFRCETLKRQAFLFSIFFFFFSCARQKGLMVPGVPSGDRGNRE